MTYIYRPNSCHHCGETNEENFHYVSRAKILGCWTCGNEIWCDGVLSPKSKINIYDLLASPKKQEQGEHP